MDVAWGTKDWFLKRRRVSWPWLGAASKVLFSVVYPSLWWSKSAIATRCGNEVGVSDTELTNWQSLHLPPNFPITPVNFPLPFGLAFHTSQVTFWFAEKQFVHFETKKSNLKGKNRLGKDAAPDWKLSLGPVSSSQNHEHCSKAQWVHD